MHPQDPPFVPNRTVVRSISVVVGTFNRASTLRLTLQHLANCEVPPETEVEIFVVDNNSTDATRETIAEVARTSRISITYIRERRQGVSHAKNAGITCARGDIVTMIDDDVVVPIGFLVSVKREYEARGWRGIVGGRVELWDPTDLPLAVLTDRSRRQLGTGQHPSGFLLGCNMSVHKEVFKAIGGFDRRLGPGTAAKAAEELDFYYRASKAGFDVIYCPDIVVCHNHGRKTAEASRALTTGYQVGRGVFYAKHALAGDRRVQRYACWELYGLLRSMFRSLLRGKGIGGDLQILSNYLTGAARFYSERRSAGISPEAIGR